jgi:UDP-N-acetylglucosamine:LPS N-acetylglucosamine transferase
VIDHLVKHRVDLIILEQPFLVGIVKIAADRLRVPVIYSCQNVEYRLRRDLGVLGRDVGDGLIR